MSYKKIIFFLGVTICSLIIADNARTQTVVQIMTGKSVGHGKSPVEFVVIDPSGRETGFDPFSDQYVDQIPEANYGTSGVGDTEGGDKEDIIQEFITSSDYPLINGLYRVKVIGVEQSGYYLSADIMRSGNLLSLESEGSSRPGSVTFFEFSYNTNPSVPITLTAVPSLSQVKGGLFNPTGSTLSVKAKPSVNFGAGNTLNSLIVTLRRLTSPSVTLGNVSSPTYGFVKMGSDTTIGSYKYQKFITTANTPLNWVAGTEYELFTVPVQGGNGNTVTFELTNALAFGQYFVEINYSDKTDTAFYKSSVTVPTVPNDRRK